MAIGDTSYLLARAHGIISRVLTKSHLTLLLSSKNLKELRAAFTQTPYGKIIGNFNFETQLSDLSRSLKNSFADILINFYNQSNSQVRRKIQWFSERYNAENLRMILEGKHTKMSKEEIIARLIPVADYSFEYYTKLIDMPIDEIIAVQKEVRLQSELKKALEEYRATDRFTTLESTIDQYIYTVLLKVSNHYKTYVNMKNILALCRCIALKVPAYRYILPNSFIAKGLKATSIQEVLDIYNYTPYSTIFSQYVGFMDVPLHELEFAVERYLLRHWNNIFRYTSGFEADSIIGFFEVKLAEIMDLIRIIVGVNAGFSEEEIRNYLIYYGSL